MKEHNEEPIPGWAIYSGLVIIGFFAAALNFVNLSDWFVQTNGSPAMAWEMVKFSQGSVMPYFFPFLVDVLLAVFTMLLLRNQLVGEPAKFYTGSIVSLTIIAVLINAIHLDVIGRVIMARENFNAQTGQMLLSVIILSLVVPGAILATTEGVKIYARSVTERRLSFLTIASLKRKVESILKSTEQLEQKEKEVAARMTGEKTRLEKEIVQATSVKRSLQIEVGRLKKSTSQPDKRWLEAAQVDALYSIGWTKERIRQEVMGGAALNTVNARLEMMNGESLKHKIGEKNG